jgi:heme/copper-type cytochrome/quinol oxidase subunit 3
MAQEGAAHAETSLGLDHRKLGIWVFLASECMFFGSLITTYLLYYDRVAGGPGPADVFDIPFTSVSTFILLMSSLTMVLAHNATLRGDAAVMRRWLVATAMLGGIFLGAQLFEYIHFFLEGLTFSTSPFSSAFYLLTGFHKLHVAVGMLMLLTLAVMSKMGRLPLDDDVRVDMVALYWHFVDIIWIIIFTFIYLIPVEV